jgi:hypothetical protein
MKIATNLMAVVTDDHVDGMSRPIHQTDRIVQLSSLALGSAVTGNEARPDGRLHLPAGNDALPGIEAAHPSRTHGQHGGRPETRHGRRTAQHNPGSLSCTIRHDEWDADGQSPQKSCGQCQISHSPWIAHCSLLPTASNRRYRANGLPYWQAGILAVVTDAGLCYPFQQAANHTGTEGTCAQDRCEAVELPASTVDRAALMAYLRSPSAESRGEVESVTGATSSALVETEIFAAVHLTDLAKSRRQQNVSDARPGIPQAGQPLPRFTGASRSSAPRPAT